jgi:hypothetical protein
MLELFNKPKKKKSIYITFLSCIGTNKIIGIKSILLKTPMEITTFLPIMFDINPKTGPPNAHPINMMLIASVLSIEEKCFTLIK